MVFSARRKTVAADLKLLTSHRPIDYNDSMLEMFDIFVFYGIEERFPNPDNYHVSIKGDAVIYQESVYISCDTILEKFLDSPLCVITIHYIQLYLRIKNVHIEVFGYIPEEYKETLRNVGKIVETSSTEEVLVCGI